MLRLSGWCALPLALALVGGSPAVADESDWDACAAGAADVSILACTRIIEAGGEADGRIGIAYYNRATAHAENGDLAEAIADYSEALRRDDGYVNAYVARGRALLEDGDAGAAIADLSRAIALLPDFPEAYFNRAAARAASGDLAGAIEDYRVTSQIAPRSGALHRQALARIAELEPRVADTNASESGWNICATGAPQDSIAACTRIIDAGMEPDERLGIAHYNLAVSYREVGDLVAAIASYGEAILLKPDYANALVGRGLLLQRQGDHSGAVADFTEALEVKPTFAEAHLNRGIALVALGEPARAAKDFRAVVDLLPATSPLFRQASDQIAKIEEELVSLPGDSELAKPRTTFARPGGAVVEVSEGELDGEAINFITLRGELKAGDDRSFKQAVLAADGPVVVRFDSPGGDLRAGMEIGRTIWTNEFATLVQDGSCASACALAWAAGRPRYATSRAEIGFHAPTSDEGEDRAADSAGSALVGGYLTELGFRSRAIIFMTESDPDEMNWLKSSRARALGIDVQSWER
jgi:tetratricopeptide (TPR) repeat protein